MIFVWNNNIYRTYVLNKNRKEIYIMILNTPIEYRILDKESKAASNGKVYNKLKVLDNGSYISLDVIPEIYEIVESGFAYKLVVELTTRYNTTENRVYQNIKVVDIVK
jgi:hypothetical protein